MVFEQNKSEKVRILICSTNVTFLKNKKKIMQQEITIENVYKRLGGGFITGQVFAAAGAFSHSLFTAPRGSKLIDFSTQFSTLSKSNGVSMAEWSLLHMAIDPFITKYIKNPYVNDIASGAATGAIMEWRNGFKGMASGAFQGVIQNIFMNSIFASIRTVSSPVLSYKYKRQMKNFQKERNEKTMMSPFNAIMSAFFPQKK